MNTLQTNQIEFTRINNDVNGNPRYVVHYSTLLSVKDRETKFPDQLTIDEAYELAIKKARKIGGKRFHNKQYGGGIVFQSYSLPELEKNINEAKNS